MGIVFRQAIKTTIVTFSGAVLGALINYVYTIAFPQNLVGVSRNLLNQGGALYLFLLMGTISVIHTYTQRYDLEDTRRPVLITYCLLTPIITTAIFCVPYFLLKGYVVSRYKGFDRQYIKEFYVWLPLLGLLLSYMATLEYYLASRMKLALGASMREIVLRVLNIGLIAAFGVGVINFHWFVIGTVIVHIIPVSALFLISLKTEGFAISFNWRVFDKAELYRVAHFAWYHMLITVTANLTAMIDVLLLGILSPLGLKDVAVYNLAAFLITILCVPYKAMMGAAFPRLNQAFVNKDPELPGYFNRSAINIQVVSVGMLLLLLANRHNIVSILPQGYENIAPVFTILSIGRMIDMSTGLNSELISITNHYKFLFRLTILLLFAIVGFEYFFIPRYGIFGAAWVATATLTAYNIAKLVFLYQKMKLLPIKRQTLYILLIGIATFGIDYLISPLSNAIADTFVRSSILASIYVSLLIVIRPSEDLSQYLAQIRKSKRLF